MKKWQEFLYIDTNLSPLDVKKELESIPEIKITDELYLNLKFEGYWFSFHNPFGGSYGYWFFYKIRRNNLEITKKLEKLLKKQFKIL